MIVKNRTHYFDEYTRVYNSFPDPNSFTCQSSKRMGYFQRLYFEFLYTQKVNGICFYYTLTYNDKSIPKYRGRNCFSYDHIRYITNGKLSKVLLRKYGSVLKYFCACESGEGAGVRGLGNNPHYHFIFFVQPAPDCVYTRISVKEFKDLIYELWQGAPSDKFVLWQFAKFGHCQEGKYNGEVVSCDAFKYVGKYVVKDLDEISFESQLKHELEIEYLTYGINYSVLYAYYKYLLQNDFGITNKYEFIDYMKLREYNLRKREHFISYYEFMCPHGSYSASVAFDYFYKWFTDYYVPDMVSQELSNYRNRYSGKCRMSKSLGAYGLNFVQYVKGMPRIILHTSEGYQVQYPCLYYIRKLFYDVKICPVTGNPLYYLNDFGISMKCEALPFAIDSFFSKTLQNISYKQQNDVCVSLDDSSREIFDILDCQDNHVNYSPSDLWDKFLSDFQSRSDYMDVLYRYSVWHCVYQYRSYSAFPSPFLTADCLEKDYLLDYHDFLCSNSFYLDFDSSHVYYMSPRKILTLSFSSHPAFLPYMSYFRYLDKLNDVVDRLQSEDKKLSFASESKHKSRLSAYRFSASVPSDAFDLSLFPSFIYE